MGWGGGRLKMMARLTAWAATRETRTSVNSWTNSEARSRGGRQRRLAVGRLTAA